MTGPIMNRPFYERPYSYEEVADLMSIIPLSFAMLCPQCESIYNVTAKQCPLCTNKNGILLGRVMNRKGELTDEGEGQVRCDKTKSSSIS